jgi:hypothetical protein
MFRIFPYVKWQSGIIRLHPHPELAWQLTLLRPLSQASQYAAKLAGYSVETVAFSWTVVLPSKPEKPTCPWEHGGIKRDLGDVKDCQSVFFLNNGLENGLDMLHFFSSF